ncbi:MAG: hypothetical protein QXK29_02970 [Candidatus Bathyarchaeia archaeon]
MLKKTEYPQALAEGVFEVYSEVSEFLSVLKPATRNVYGCGLAAFQEFYLSLNKGFFGSCGTDRLLPRIKRKHVDGVTLNNFVVWLQSRGYSPKTVRSYVGAVQSLAKCFDIPISLRYVRLPLCQPVNGKDPWMIEEVGQICGFNEQANL